VLADSHAQERGAWFIVELPLATETIAVTPVAP
jgi:hypothetical protein